MSEQSYYQAGAQGSAPQPVSAEPVSEVNDAASVEQQEQKGNEPVTQEQLKSAMEEILRKSQSMTDKLGARVDQRIKEAKERAEIAIKTIEENGITLTQEQKHAIMRGETDKALLVDEPASSEAKGQQEQGEDPISKFVNGEVRRIMSETKVYISPEEARTLIGETDSPYVFLRKFEELARERAGNTTPPEVRMPSIAPASGQSLSASGLKAQYEKEIEMITSGTHPKIRRGDVDAVLRLKAEYRKRGLEI